MFDMPRQRPPHLQHETTRHGKTVWYVRLVEGGPRTRIRAAYGTEEFKREYDAAVSGSPLTARPTVAAGTLQWLYDRYRESRSWLDYSTATRKQRENIFRPVMAQSGAVAFKSIKRTDIEAGRDKRTPSQGRHFVDAMRGMFEWALGLHTTFDPTAGVKYPKQAKTHGFPEWTEEDVLAYERRWPRGTRQRIWLDVLIYTGGRRGDAHAIGRQHITMVGTTRALCFRTEKSGRMVDVTIPFLDALAESVAVGPCADLAFICGAKGGPLTKESFGNEFSAAARAAGVYKSAHGVRKIAATRCAERGATIHQLNAIFGWIGTKMAMLYTQAADRKRLSMQAGHMLERTSSEQSTPAPSGEVREPSLKIQRQQ